MLLGRDISLRDKPDLPGVAVVNERFAKANFGNRNPLGRHVSVSIGGPRDLEIVGICANSGTADSFQRSEWISSAIPNIDTTTPMGRLFYHVIGSFADYAECAIMQSHSAEMAVWPVFQ
jgi:hypothetical protein